MSEVLNALYELRVLRGRCEGGASLDTEQIHRMSQLERQVPKLSADVQATLRKNKFADPVRVGLMSAAQLVCHQCPWLEVGNVVEIVIDEDRRSYRFKMFVTACREDDNGDLDAILTHVGVPVLLRRGPKSQSSAPSIERVAA